MKKLVCALLFACAPTALASKFDWKKLQGRYDFIECRDQGLSVWPENRADFFVEIYQPLEKPWEPTLNLTLIRRDSSPIILGYDILAIDKGTFKVVNPHTGQVEGVHRNDTLKNGIRGKYSWDFVMGSDFRVWGNQSIELQLSEDGNTLSYAMSLKHDTDPERREWCRLKRQPKDEN